MASAGMPGASSKTITPASTSKKQGHLVAGRRKLEEYRKNKNKTTEKPGTSALPENIFANGSAIDEGEVKENPVVSHSSSAVVNGLGAWPGGKLQQGKDNGKPHNLWIEQAGSSSEEVSNNAKSSVHGIPLPWMGGTEQGSSIHDLETDIVFQRKTGAPATQVIASFKQEGSTGVVSDGPLLYGSAENNWRRPYGGALSGLSSTASSHDSSMAGTVSKQQTQSSFPSRPLDKSSFQPALPSIPAQQTSVAAAPSMVTSEGEPVSSTAAWFDEKGRHDMKPVNEFEESQRSENDDFAALEQHIDDLTQEKYSLQRALDAARSLAESLSQQNSALTEDFNSQGAVINQLQVDLERKKEEVTSQSLILSSFMMARERAQQENNSAVERSQILAGEVIGLEEKVLKLRSSELKLQRELESLKSENDSYRGHLATLEKDRKNLRSMLEALQEDKKLLQGQLQKKIMNDSSKTPNTKGVEQKDSRDVSTSTDDLGVLDASAQNTETKPPLVEGNVGSSQLRGTLDNTYEASSSTTIPSSHHHSGFSMRLELSTVPADDLRVINNIDTLITELLSEKSSLLETLRRESSKASELQALNTELSKKLEAQTQRLELVFAQNMAHGGSATVTNSNQEEQQDGESMDEGDEVVERVLGWIMRLFPGGSSRRRLL